ncbi:MAG: tetratricopeptide repeat protein [Alphaproteobacteria bacterium]
MAHGLLRMAAAAAFLLAATSSVAADQKDPRLDALFAVLQVSQDAEEVRVSELEIWRIWMQSDDAEADSLMARGLAAMHARDMERALAIYSELVAKAPDFAEAWNKRATVYFVMGELKASLADVERTLALEPRHFGALSGAGQIQLQRGLLRPAYEAFRRALAVNPHLRGPRMFVDMLRDEIEGKPL